jgi:hypothetical protein
MGAKPTKMGLGFAPMPLRTSGLEPWLSTPHVPTQGTVWHQTGRKPDIACYITDFCDDFTWKHDTRGNPGQKTMDPTAASRLASEGWAAFADDRDYRSRPPHEQTGYTWYYRPCYQRWALGWNKASTSDAWHDCHALT